jgi:hypothetical protein
MSMAICTTMMKEMKEMNNNSEVEDNKEQIVFVLHCMAAVAANVINYCTTTTTTTNNDSNKSNAVNMSIWHSGLQTLTLLSTKLLSIMKFSTAATMVNGSTNGQYERTRASIVAAALSFVRRTRVVAPSSKSFTMQHMQQGREFAWNLIQQFS